MSGRKSLKHCRCYSCSLLNYYPEFRTTGIFGEFRGFCGMCGRTDLELVSMRQPLIVEFFKLESGYMCWACKNRVQGLFYELNLCWGRSSEEELKWGLAEVALDKLKEHLSWPKGHGRGFKEMECCRAGLHKVEINMKINNFDETASDYVRELRAAMTMDEVHKVLAKYAPIVPDAIEQAKNLTWDIYYQAVVWASTEGHGHDEEAVKLVGNIVMPDLLIQVSVVADHFNVPWGLAFNRMLQDGMIIQDAQGNFHLSKEVQ